MNVKVCGHCGSQNDSTRVFCANCGSRLPEESVSTVLSAEAPAAAMPVGSTAPPIAKPIRQTPQRSAQKTAQKPAGGGLLGILVRELILMACLGAVLGGLIQMVREPDGIPPRTGASAANARALLTTLRELRESGHPISWTINQNAINEFLITTIQMQSSAGPGAGAQFQRAFVRLGTGKLSLGVEQQALNHSLYFLLDLLPETSAQGITAKPVGGAIGRLQVPPALLPFFMRLFQPTIEGLAQPLDLIRHAKSVAVKPEDITLQWVGAGTSSR